jgi:hypothetical protein
MKTRKPLLKTEVFLTLDDRKILERLLSKENLLTRHSIDQSYHTHLGHLADTLSDAAEEIDF